MATEDRDQIKYLHLLTICGSEWREKVNLAIFDSMPSDDDIKAVIKLYWSRYEIGLFPAFESFMAYLKESGKKDVQVRLGIWVEKVPTFHAGMIPKVSEEIENLSRGLQECEDQNGRGTEDFFDTNNRESED
jgi:hypothetical protein